MKRPATTALLDARDEAPPVSVRLSFAATVLAWLAFSAPWLTGAVTIPWDGKAHFAPQIQFMAASFARGEWPFWTPHVFAGHPQIADPQAMMFSPPMLVLALFDAQPSLRAIDTAVLLTVLFGGLGVATYARLQRWHWAAGAVAAVIFMFGGSMAWRLQHFGQVMSLAYVPFTLAALIVATDDQRTGAIRLVSGLAAGLLGGVILLGRDQVAVLAIYVLAAYAITRLLRPRRAHNQTVAETFATCIARRLWPLLAGLAAGVAIIAVPLLLTLTFAEHSNRPTIDLAGAEAGSLHPALLATAIAANLFGSGGDMAGFWGPPSFHWEDTGLFTAQNMGVVYMSALAVFAFVFGLARDRAMDKPVAIFVIAGTVMLIYALGRFTPVFEIVYAWVPGIDRFRRPADATFLLCGLMAFAVGYFVHLMLDDARRDRGHWIDAVFAAVAALLIGAITVLAVWRGQFEAATTAILMGAALFAGTLIVWRAVRWLMPIRPIAAGALLVAAIAGDLILSNGPNGATALPTRALDMLQPDRPHPTIAALQTLVRDRTDRRQRPRVELLGLGYHWQNASLTHGLEATMGMNPLYLAWTGAATGARDTVPSLADRPWTPLMAGYDSPMARMLGITYVAAPTQDAAKALSDGGPFAALTPVARVGNHQILEVSDPLPRVVFASRAAAIDVDDAVATGRLPNIADGNVVLLQRAAINGQIADAGAQIANVGETQAAAERPPGAVAITSQTNTRVSIAVNAAAPGWVVLHDVWHPWWRATINGQPAPLLRANVIFRAVRVPAGKHDVVFEFAPLTGAFKQARAWLSGAAKDNTP